MVSPTLKPDMAGFDTSANTDELRQPPFSDPRKEIQLLRIQPRGIHDDIICGMTVFVTNVAPPYGAISHTWGLLYKVKGITINGQRAGVGQNCYYVLWQVRSHDFYEHYRIDALCIKTDLEEKVYQVQMMETYKRAESVLASVGPDYDNSKILVFALFGLEAELLRLDNNVRTGTEVLNSVSEEDQKPSMTIFEPRRYRDWLPRQAGRYCERAEHRC